MSLRILPFCFPCFVRGRDPFVSDTHTLLRKAGDERCDSLHALKIKGRNVRQNVSNYLFVSPLLEKEISVHLQFVLEFIFCHATAVAAVQFLCNFGAALQEKYLVMCMSYLLASFFMSFLDYFALLVLISFCASNVLRKEKNLSL